MYIDPFAADGLFPLAEDDTKSERDLPYEFKPDVDYFAKFDAVMPAWTPPRYGTMTGSEAAWSERAELREVAVARRKVMTISHRRYARAIAPDGTVRQMKISTVRATPAFPDGIDACATQHRFTAKKWNRGWIPVERDEWLWTPYAGYRGQQYAAWAWAVMEYRLKRQGVDVAEYTKGFESQSSRAINKQTEVIAQALTSALAARDAEQPKARK